MAGEEGHGFDRRGTDVNVAALATRLGSLEGRVEVLEEQGRTANRELAANTRLTKQSHEAIFGTGDDPGMKAVVDQVNLALQGVDEGNPGLIGKVESMHAVFEPARNGFRMIGKIGNAAMAVSDAIERRPKTTALLVITSVVGWSAATTGKLPDWFTAMMKALIA